MRSSSSSSNNNYNENGIGRFCSIRSSEEGLGGGGGRGREGRRSGGGCVDDVEESKRMMENSSEQPNSMLHVSQLQMYPLPTGGDNTGAPPPFQLLYGEGIVHSGHSVYGSVVLTNYRLFLQLCETQHHVPLGLLEVAEQRDLFYLHIGCKDARTYKLTFDNNETCSDWCSRLTKAFAPPTHLEELFAFFYFVWSKEDPMHTVGSRLDTQHDLLHDERSFNAEVERLKFNLHGTWRISSVNKNYKLCSSYPPNILVPAYITDEVLETVAKFRSSRRIPAVVWRHVGNGAVIARCSQPEVGWLGWRSAEDEDLIKAISEACTQDRGPHTLYVSHSPASANSSIDESTHIQSDIEITERKKVLIMDARSYTTAVANRARGGGCECPEYYPSGDIQFMNLANIHTIRKSFHSLRQLCASSSDQPNWFSQLEGTRWLHNMSGLFRAAVTLVTAVERDARPVLVHCSDGWDRTPQIVALGEILLDPFYRTFDGFRVLIEREWLSFGHKFADRCGHATGSDDLNERCPVFLQWLDCVHQLIHQFPCDFEMSHTYLVKLAQHVFSNLFGTFLCNTKMERERIYDTTLSVWTFLSNVDYKNHLYAPQSTSTVLWPKYQVRDLKMWSEVYLGSMEMQNGSTTNGSDGGGGSQPNGDVVSHQNNQQQKQQQQQQQQQQQMTKTRSYGDLLQASGSGTHVRRCSDPSVIVEAIKTNGHKLDADSAVALNGDGNSKDCDTDFLCELEGDDCKSDCIYNKNARRDEPTVAGQQKPKHLLDATNLVIEKTDEDDDDDDNTCVNCNNVESKMSKVEQQQQQQQMRRSRLTNGGDSIDGGSVAADAKCDSAVLAIDFKSKQCNRTLDDEADGGLGGCGAADTGGGELMFSVCLDKSVGDVIVNGNGQRSTKDADSVDSDTEPSSESRSDNIVTVIGEAGGVRRLTDNSVDTSTETLVSDNNVGGSTSSKELNGFEKVVSADLPSCDGGGGSSSDSYKMCAHRSKFVHGKHSHSHDQHLQQQQQQQNGGGGGGSVVSERTSSRYPTPPQYSRTPSANGWDSFLYCNNSPPKYHSSTILDDDGLMPLKSDVQERLKQIMEENRRKVEALQRELHTYRQALIKQVCHKCSHNEADKNDETSSVVESVCSAGEGQASAVESLRSDMSWEAVEEGPSLLEGIPTLWVPDHAVSRCTGCSTVFWLGRRKHHCRNCGRIFCADCSENSTPLPSEQLYDPVRVCTSCYSKLRRRECGEIPEQCKHSSSSAANNNPHQITATSN